jgi:hypothetical protein
MRQKFILGIIISSVLTIILGLFVWPPIWWAFVIIGPLVLLGLYDMTQKQHALLRNFPVAGHGRYISDWLRPKIYQYFVEPDHDGRPFNRIFRSIVYQRAKDVLDTAPFGTQFNVYAEGYEWMNHSIAALDPHSLDTHPRVTIGGPSCKRPSELATLPTIRAKEALRHIMKNMEVI